MSNLITPMLTSVDNSPVDFYPSIHCTIINNGSDHHSLCLSDNSDWNDLEQLVSQNSNYVTSTPIKSKAGYNRNVFSNNSSFTNKSAMDFNNSFNRDNQQKNFSDITDSKPSINTWNNKNKSDNLCLKACVNVNMGYNEGNSFESLKRQEVQEIVEDPMKDIMCNNKIVFSRPPVTNTNMKFNSSITAPLSYDINQIKTFKNGAKTGHSRQWGSCGSAGTLRLNIDPLASGRHDFNDLFDTTCKIPNEVIHPNRIPQNDAARIKSSDKSINTLKRISQVSFEAEFDSEGRIHEQVSLNLKKIDPDVLAGQITLIELGFFKAIKSEEFLSFKWNANSKYVYAPNIVASTKWFNQLTFWVQKMILECKELNKRSDMLGYFIRVVKKLVDNYNNLCSAKSVMSALQVECIHRLRQTWSGLSSREKTTFKRMEDLFSNDNNNANLRNHITFMKLPCIPYIGLFLSDLIYINTAHAKTSEFESQTKNDQINNILRVFSEFQQSTYDIPVKQTIQRYLESQRYIEELQKIIEDNNFRTSLSLEPRIPPDSSQLNQGMNSSVLTSATINSNPSGVGGANNTNHSGPPIASTHADFQIKDSAQFSPQKLTLAINMPSSSSIMTSGTVTCTNQSSNITSCATVPASLGQPSFSCQHNLQEPISPQPLIPHSTAEACSDSNTCDSDAAVNIVHGESHGSILDSCAAQSDVQTSTNPALASSVTSSQLERNPSLESLKPSLFCGPGRKHRSHKSRQKSISQSTKSPLDAQANYTAVKSKTSSLTHPSSASPVVTLGSLNNTATVNNAPSSSSDLYHPSNNSSQHQLNTTLHSMSLLDDSFLDQTNLVQHHHHPSSTASVSLHHQTILPHTTSSCNTTASQSTNTSMSLIAPVAVNNNTTTDISVLAHAVHHSSDNVLFTTDNKQQKLFCTPPIMKCIIKQDAFDLKPKASSKRQTEFANLVNVANAAQTAARISKLSCKSLSKLSSKPIKEDIREDNDDEDDDDEDDDDEDNVTAIGDDSKDISTSPNTTLGDNLILYCQGVLLRKTCSRTGGRRALFSSWKRYWVMLLVSDNTTNISGFLVYFEPAGSSALLRQATQRRHFKLDKCCVQDLREAQLKFLSNTMEDHHVDNKTSNNSSTKHRKEAFLLTDVEYGNVYKFRAVESLDLSSRDVITKKSKIRASSRKKQHNIPAVVVTTRDDTEHDYYDNNKNTQVQATQPAVEGSNALLQPSLTVWYQIIQRTIQCINNSRRSKDDKDLIVLGDN